MAHRTRDYAPTSCRPHRRAPAHPARGPPGRRHRTRSHSTGAAGDGSGSGRPVLDGGRVRQVGQPEPDGGYLVSAPSWVACARRWLTLTDKIGKFFGRQRLAGLKIGVLFQRRIVVAALVGSVGRPPIRMPGLADRRPSRSSVVASRLAPPVGSVGSCRWCAREQFGVGPDGDEVHFSGRRGGRRARFGGVRVVGRSGVGPRSGGSDGGVPDGRQLVGRRPSWCGGRGRIGALRMIWLCGWSC
jgi:hypothetical protein